MKKIVYIFLFISTSVLANQEKEPSLLVKQVQEYILLNKTDSALVLLKNVVASNYKEILKKIVNDEQLTYLEYNNFLENVSTKRGEEYLKVSEFINKRINKPTSKTKINSNYFNIKWNQVNKLRNETFLDDATKINKKLSKYINQFDDSNLEVKKLKTKITTHAIVMYNIRKDMAGKELCLESLEIARNLDEPELEITFLYYLTDFLILERKLKEYIDTCERALSIAKENNVDSPYYYSVMSNLINAYIYKKGHDNRVQKLLSELYDNRKSKYMTYSLYMQLLTTVEKESPIINTILKKFEVNTVLELARKFEKEEKKMGALEFASFLGHSGRALNNLGYHKDATSFRNSQVEKIKMIYSKDLSNSLANYKTELAMKEKENEIRIQKEKSKIYALLTFIVGIFFVSSLFVIKKIRNQSRDLDAKNKIISKNLKEKELLVKEVHHRVKNNFQIVSSLLELQTRGIEDKKALALAKEGKNRVRSMALIHQKLYQNDTGLVDFDEYLDLLVSEIHALYESETQVKTTLISENSKFDIDTAIPLGLILNEIITNAYKYAFTPEKKNTLLIKIGKENKEYYKLIIADNGLGIPENLEIKKVKSLGLRLVNRLVKQLHGKMIVENRDGAYFEILFKDESARKAIS